MNIGDQVPPLTIEAWVKGDPIAKFEGGRAYVVEFWATWCAPCVQSMPHLTKLQETEGARGLTVIGVSSSDARGVEDVRPFVERSGDRMGYTVAVDKDRATWSAWMAATGQSSIPVAFVVDRSGRLAWLGNPISSRTEMDSVIGAVLEDRFDIDGAAKEARSLRDLFGRATKHWEAEEHDKALALLDEIVAISPRKYSTYAQLKLNSYAQPLADVKGFNAYAARLIDTTYLNDPEMLGMFARVVLEQNALEGRDLTIARRGAARACEITLDTDPSLLDLLASAQFQTGALDEAVRTQMKALAICPAASQTEYYQRLVRYRDALEAKPTGSTAAPTPRPVDQKK